MGSDFSDYCCSSLENENTLPIEKEKHFTQVATKGVIQICVWQLLLKPLKNVCEGIKLKKKIEIKAFLVTFQRSSSQLQNSYATKKLFSKRPLDGYSQLLNLLWPEPCMVMFVYGSRI